MPCAPRMRLATCPERIPPLDRTRPPGRGPRRRPTANPNPGPQLGPAPPKPKTPRAPNDFRHMEKDRPAWHIQPPTAEGLLAALGVIEAPFAERYRAVRQYVRTPPARAMPGAVRSELRRRNLLPRRGSGRAMACDSLDDARANVDRVDEEIVELLAERAAYVRQAARFKPAAAAVAAPRRAEQVIAQARGFAQDQGLDPDLVEGVYRELVAGFVALEHREHASFAYDSERGNTDAPGADGGDSDPGNAAPA